MTADQNQQWDIVSSVGLTALAVSAARAVETHRDNRLAADPHAAHFVRAANPPAPMPTSPAEFVEGDEIWDVMSDYMGLRTRFFDDYFSSCGVDQAVILAAGLDTRAHRLDWPDGFDLYEVDQPKVLEFKQQVLDEKDARPACRRHVVPTDLRDDWVAALSEAGFDPGRPTAWLAEGLLPYLPAKAEEDLFELIHKLSAPGSVLALEQAPARAADDFRNHPLFESASERFGIDITQLWNTEPRRDCLEWLRSAGWDVTAESAVDTAVRYGRELPPDITDHMGQGLMATARRAS
jgi:methyltransferase (TIGR00027 family)